MAKDVRAVFRNLVNNQYMEDFDYYNTQFTFKAVYSISKYTYRCCPCGFEHEYLDYIGKDGKIREEMYESIVNNIMAGTCTHVKDVNEEDTAETGYMVSPLPWYWVLNQSLIKLIKSQTNVIVVCSTYIHLCWQWRGILRHFQSLLWTIVSVPKNVSWTCKDQ